MSEVLQANDTWIAAPLREVLADGRTTGAFAVDSTADTANAVLGALLLAVLGRSITGADPTDPRLSTATSRTGRPRHPHPLIQAG